MITSPHCPVCRGTSFTPYLTAKDHTVSHETFTIMRCTRCGFLVTFPIPDNLQRYYASDKYISHTNTANNVTDALYKLARQATLRWKINLITHYNKTNTTTLLDYGCGTGAFLHHAKKRGWQITGVEPSKHARTQAQHLTQAPIAESLAEVSATHLSIITLWHVLEHIHLLHETLDQLQEKLAPTGTIFIAVPNHRSHDAQHYKEFWAAYDVPRHLWHFTRNDMAKLLSAHNLTIKDVVPMKLDAFYVSILSEKYKAAQPATGIAPLLRGACRGFISNLRAVNTREYSSLIYIATR